MNVDIALKALIAITPALLFLALLIRLDSHHLIGERMLALVFGAGIALALATLGINSWVLPQLDLEFVTYSRLVAPVIEETMKALVLVALFRRDRVGFQVDAAILGFTTGAGFSFFENIFYLSHATDAHYATWMVRGFGTAIMHGGCTAMFAVMSQILTERHLRRNALWYLPGLLAAILFHSLFNHFPVSPVLSTVATLLIIPTVLFLLFERNEVAIHDFLEQDFEAHRRLLEQLRNGDESDCETGRFLRDLPLFVKPPLDEHMRTYVHLHTELILSAEGILLARERGVDITVEDETHRKIEELHLLERRIGRAGMETLRPHLRLSTHEFWLIHSLEQ